ncbi:MAG: hypothetical protein IPP28_02650 [Xanthomonadales bacterium]|nr:hypothetical protein [Xanthomonadales bacterium]
MNRCVRALGGLMLIVAGRTTAGAAATVASPLDPLKSGLNGAGCEYRDLDTQDLVMVTLSRSLPDDGRGIARVSVQGEEQQLDRIDTGDSGRQVFRNDQVHIVARDFGPIDPCAGSECEGSRQRAVLDVRQGTRRVRVAVDVHCGA